MPTTLVGFSESQDSATLVNVAALADAHVRISGDDIIVPKFADQLIGVYGLGPNITRAMLLSPTLRRMMNLEVSPLDLTAIPASPHRAAFFPQTPIPLTADEAMNAQASEGGAGATRSTIGVWLSDGPLQPVGGEIYTVRVTNATTLVANVWTNGALTFDQTLQPGRYALVGAHLRSTNLQLFRFVGVGDSHRPGGIGSAAISDILLPGQRRGGWGEWLQFDHNTPPTVDFLSNGADTSQVGELDLVKVG